MKDERGMSASVQVTLVMPAAIGLLLLLMQWALIAWAESTALAAAQHGAMVAARMDGDVDTARGQARNSAEGGALTRIAVTIDRGSRSTTATVTGSAVSLLWPRTVSRTVTVTTERLTGS